MKKVTRHKQNNSDNTNKQAKKPTYDIETQDRLYRESHIFVLIPLPRKYTQSKNSAQITRAYFQNNNNIRAE